MSPAHVRAFTEVRHVTRVTDDRLCSRGATGGWPDNLYHRDVCSGFVGEKSGAGRAVFEVFEAKFSGYRVSILVLLSPASSLPGEE